MLLPGHPGGVIWYKQPFWTFANNCDMEQQEPFWLHQGYENFKILKWIQDLPHPS